MTWTPAGLADLLGMMAAQSAAGALAVAGLVLAPLVALAPLLISSWRAGTRAAPVAATVWLLSVVTLLALANRLQLSDRLAFTAVIGVMPIAVLLVCGSVARGVLSRAGLISAIAIVAGSALFLPGSLEGGTRALLREAVPFPVAAVCLGWLCGLLVRATRIVLARMV